MNPDQFMRARHSVAEKTDELVALAYGKYVVDMTRPWNGDASTQQERANGCMAGFQTGITALYALEDSALRLIEHLSAVRRTPSEERNNGQEREERERDGSVRPTAEGPVA